MTHPDRERHDQHAAILRAALRDPAKAALLKSLFGSKLNPNDPETVRR